MKKIDTEKIISWHNNNCQKELDIRHLTLEQMQPYIEGLGSLFKVEKIGKSHQGRDIHKIVFGEGDSRILLWTQMHGNESTGTRAFLDLIQFFTSPGEFSQLADLILKECTIHCVPMLNPDGAQRYTRVNAQDIDLNRDVIDLKAIESQLLMRHLKNIDPEYCFNLHDQRTIFSIPPENQTATMSFLAPSVDQERTLTEGRKDTMRVIVSMNKFIQQLVPGRVGRYTDEFYPTATGDNFQKMGHNTILIESGHSKGDYQRKESRRITFLALLEGLRYISSSGEKTNYQEYFAIPNNEKKYLDIIMRNVVVSNVKNDIGILYVEQLKNGSLQFKPKVDQIGNLEEFNADRFIDDKELKFDNNKDVEFWVENNIN